MSDTYYAERHAGPWPAGTEIPAADFEAYPFKDKFLRSGAVVKTRDRRAPDAADVQQQVADLDAQIAQLQAQRNQLLGGQGEPNAPAQVTFDLDRNDQPSAQEADRNRAAGKEVVQPTATDVVVGTVEPGEAAQGSTAGSNAQPTADHGKRERK